MEPAIPDYVCLLAEVLVRAQAGTLGLEPALRLVHLQHLPVQFFFLTSGLVCATMILPLRLGAGIRTIV